MATPATVIEQQPESYFKKQIKLLKFLGISFTGNESIAYRLYSFLLLFSSVFTYMVFDGYELFKHDFETSSDIIMYESVVIITMIKIAIVFINRIKFGNVLSRLQREPFLPNPSRGSDEEEKLIGECNWMIDVQTYGYWIIGSTSILLSSGYAVSTRLRNDDYRKWEFGFGPLTVLNVTHSPNYEISLSYQIYAIYVVVGHFSTIDLAIMGVLAHISYQFKILQNFIRLIIVRSYEEMLKDQTGDPQKSGTEIVPSYDEIDPSKIPWKYLQKSLKRAVRYHQAIIDLAEEMEQFFRYLLMIAFLMSLAVLCFELYHALSEKTTIGMLRHALEFSGCVLQVGAYCYWGEQVLIESEEVGRAAVESNFVGSDVRFQKGLVLMIRRSQKPTRLTAGKFADICMATFAWVMRTSYTVFMVVRNIKTQEI